MARVKLTEYKAKKLLLGDAYQGISFGIDGAKDAPAGSYVAKVDQGVKKRFKQGLVQLEVPANGLGDASKPWQKKGFKRFLAEPYLPHETNEERYFSLERVRDGIRMLYAAEGGVDIEAHPESVKTYIIRTPEDSARVANESGLPESFLENTVKVFEENYFAFLEINPLLVRGNECFLLDAAVLVDSAAALMVRGRWSEDDIVESAPKHESEGAVARLAKTTPASLKLSVLNPDGSLFLLLSGGGGSIVIADEAALLGMGQELADYGEYSGGPTREETYLYAKEILGLLLDSKAKKKGLVIAGGIANFTDVQKTFAGIIDALKEREVELKKAGVKVFVRRGGPNEKAGLARMREYLQTAGLLGEVYGSDTVITKAIDDAVTFVRS